MGLGSCCRAGIGWGRRPKYLRQVFVKQAVTCSGMASVDYSCVSPSLRADPVIVGCSIQSLDSRKTCRLGAKCESLIHTRPIRACEPEIIKESDCSHVEFIAAM